MSEEAVTQERTVRKYTPRLREHYSSVMDAIAFFLKAAASLRAGRLDVRVMVNARFSFWYPEEAGHSLGQSTLKEIDALCAEWNRSVQNDGNRKKRAAKEKK